MCSNRHGMVRGKGYKSLPLAGAFLGAMLLGLVGLGLDLAAGKERPEGDTAS